MEYLVPCAVCVKENLAAGFTYQLTWMVDGKQINYEYLSFISALQMKTSII